MGLFGEKETCSLCGGKVSLITKTKLSDGVMCAACFAKCSPLCTSLNNKTVADIEKHIRDRERNAEAYKTFTPTDNVGEYLKIDRKSQTWCCPTLDKKNPDIFSFSELIDFELNEDGESITKGGLGSAVVGGALFGGVGAIVGSNVGKKQKGVVNKMSVVINLRNEFVSHIEIPLIKAETKKNSFVYKVSKDEGQSIAALLSVIVDSQKESTPAPAAAASSADELLKFKQLWDAGVITEDEFNAKKKQLLGL